MNKSVNENIKRIRRENGLTQKELGEKLGVSQSAIGQFEKNGANLKLSTIKKISSVLGVSMDDIMGTWQEENILDEPSILNNPSLTKREESLLADFRKLNNEGQQYILQTMDMVKDKYIKSDSVSELEDIG